MKNRIIINNGRATNGKVNNKTVNDKANNRKLASKNEVKIKISRKNHHPTDLDTP